MWRVSYLVGIIGLNELVQIHTGKELHESKDVLKLGLKVISYMKLKCEELVEEARHALRAGADAGGVHRLQVRLSST